MIKKLKQFIFRIYLKYKKSPFRKETIELAQELTNELNSKVKTNDN